MHEKDLVRENWDLARAFHGHECPGLAIGVRVCDAAMVKLGISRGVDEEIVCVAENDACGVDAVQAILGCTVGKGNLILRMTGKQAFTFYARERGAAMRFYLKAGRGDMTRGEFMEYLLSAPIDEIFECREVSCLAPERARIFDSVECEDCGEIASEAAMHLARGKKVCEDCFRKYKYNRGWQMI